MGLRSDQSLRDRLCHRLRSIDHIEASHGLIAVKVHRPLAQAEDDCNLGGGLSPAHPRENFLFPLGQVDVGLRSSATVGASESVLDNHTQHLEIDWFGEVVVGPEPATSQFAVAITQSGQEDEGNICKLRTGFRQLLEQLEPSHTRHPDIAENEVGSLGDDLCQRYFPVRRKLNRIAEFAQSLREQARRLRVVLDAQDRAHWYAPRVHWAPQ